MEKKAFQQEQQSTDQTNFFHYGHMYAMGTYFLNRVGLKSS